MAKGRNTTVISLRLPDEVVKALRSKAEAKGVSLSDYLKQDKLFQPEVLNEKQDLSQVRNRHGNLIPESDWEDFRKHPGRKCPCGSKLPFRDCHGKNLSS
jgi:hypothetical protein